MGTLFFPLLYIACMIRGGTVYAYVWTFSSLHTHTDVEDNYCGPKLDDDISAGFMKNVLQWFKDQKKLHKKYCYKVIVCYKFDVHCV